MIKKNLFATDFLPLLKMVFQYALNLKDKYQVELFNIGMFQREGTASKEIISYAEKINSDFMIIGSKGHSKISVLLVPLEN